MRECDFPKTIAVRLEGGIGDHLLGMRILHFIRGRYPQHEIVAYSDSAGHPVPLQVAQMSPYVAKVVPVYQNSESVCMETLGNLENIQEKYLVLMRSAGHFFDTWGDSAFISESHTLDVPLFELLAHHTELTIPESAETEATNLLSHHRDRVFVGLNLSKYGAAVLQRNRELLRFFITQLLEDPNVVILNLFNSVYEFSHWPEP